MTEPFASIPLVIDTSAWVRQRDPDMLARWDATARARLFASCPVVALELLSGARDEAEHARLATDFDALPQAPVTTSACRAALAASQKLRGSRRLPAADYLIAAAADRGFGVLHEDRHFETLATVLGFASVRLTN